MTGLHGILFAYEGGRGLGELAQHRVPASVPFGGRYRIIDFMLSNLANAEVTDVGVVMEGNYQSLLDHLGNGRVWDMTRKFGGLKLLPPYVGRGAYRGWMDALRYLKSYVEEIRQEYVLLSNSDVVVNLPLREVIDRHVSSGADVTVICTSNTDSGVEDTYFRVDEGGKVTETLHRVQKTDGKRSLGIYILSKELLLKAIDECAAHDEYNFIAGVLQNGELAPNVHAFVWDGFAVQIKTLKQYHECSMKLLRPEIRADLFCRERPIRAKVDDEAASYIAPDAHCVNSLVADGCMIEGSVEDSILFPGVTVARGAKVKNCILMKNMSVGEGAQLDYIIADKGVALGSGTRLAGNENYPMAVAKHSIV